jgi:dihydroxyacid dehydratase/phosphogluconate dehydratase
MHSGKFKDPLISQPQPVTLIVPVIEEALRAAGVSSTREHVLERFMCGQPRIAVIHGSEDHPPYLGSKEMIRRLIRHVWTNGALPFEVSQSMPCEQLSYGTEGVHYALLSRNLCAASLATHMEAQGYDAAIVSGVCDKMMVGNLRALVEADLARQRRKARPIFAMFIPSLIGRDAFVTEEDRRKFEPLRHRLSQEDRQELEDLLRRPLKPHVYAQIKSLLDRCFHRRIVQENEKDELERVMAKCTSVPGANCAASEASMVHRMMLASFGLVPRHLDIAVKTPSDEQLSEIVKRLIHGIQKRERRVSVASLVRSNFLNAATVWSATGGHPSWLLHLTYLANAIGKKVSTADVTRKTCSIPQILAINEVSGNSVYAMAVETESGGNSGIDTIMRTLAEKRLIEDRAPTLDGSWMQRIMDARSANGNFLYSTMTPYSPSCGLVGMHGNICAAAIARAGVQGRNGSVSVAEFDKKLYLALYYLGLRDFQADLTAPEAVLERLKRKVSREDLYYTYLFNWPSNSAAANGLDASQWNKNRLWDYLITEQLLRVMVVVAGAGPRATGMPELQFVMTATPHLKSTCALATDGRVSFQHEGVSVSHIVPEALDGGGIAAIRTGDWIYMDLSRGELHVAVPARNGHHGYKILSVKDLMNRPERKKRVNELEKRRTELLPSFRTLLDQVSSAEAGVSPANKPS